ncbi:MAG: four helix bundle protein [Bacteroidales bacterium]|nr:four helix bundle protein [Bacteroidales bacterium]
MYMFNFEKLEVWKKSREYTKKVYTLTKRFPDEEKFGLTNQLRRSAISVCSNIAEGSSRISKKDQKHFYNMAYSSIMENINQILISEDLEYITTNDIQLFRKEVNIISYMLNNLRLSVDRKSTSTKDNMDN